LAGIYKFTENTNQQIEIWKDIPGYEGIYQVSSLGRVKSLSRIMLNRGKYPSILKERILSKASRKNKYEQVHLSKNKKSKYFTVHQLVARVRRNKILTVIGRFENEKDARNAYIKYIENEKTI